MRIKLAQTNSKKRYLVFTTDDARKRAVDPTRLLAYSQPQNRYFRARVEKVGLRLENQPHLEERPTLSPHPEAGAYSILTLGSFALSIHRGQSLATTAAASAGVPSLMSMPSLV